MQIYAAENILLKLLHERPYFAGERLDNAAKVLKKESNEMKIMDKFEI